MTTKARRKAMLNRPAPEAENQQHEALKRQSTSKAVGNKQEMSEVYKGRPAAPPKANLSGRQRNG